MRRLLSTAATAALLACAGHLAAQATDTTDYAPQPDRVDDYERDIEYGQDAEYDRDADLDVEEPIAPGEYELREVRDPEDLERDTTGMTPKNVDATEVEEVILPAEVREPEGAPGPRR